MPLSPPYFDSLFAASDDPWGFRTRWYEQRKRALTLACLPASFYDSIFEPGCANGELAADLAPRCHRLLACDASVPAVRLARQRLRDVPHARVETMTMPADWPAEQFDLIVISELGYYLPPADLATLARACLGSLTDTGTLLACHWRPLIDGCAYGGDAVHEILAAETGLPRIVHHQEDDFVLDVWTRQGQSVGRAEGLT